MDNTYKNNQKPNSISKVEESAVEYLKTINSEIDAPNKEWDDLPDDIKKILLKSSLESDQDLGISHEEMMKIVKAKYPFVNGI